MSVTPNQKQPNSNQNQPKNNIKQLENNRKPTLKNLRHAYSPTINPLIEPQQITTKRRYVRSGRADELMNTATGEITAVTTIHQVEERDDAPGLGAFNEELRVGVIATVSRADDDTGGRTRHSAIMAQLMAATRCGTMTAHGRPDNSDPSPRNGCRLEGPLERARV